MSNLPLPTSRNFLLDFGLILPQNQCALSLSALELEYPDRAAEELDNKLAQLLEQEAALRKQKETEMSYEDYLCWQRTFDKVNQQLVEVLQQFSTSDDHDN